jgi:hypothetical protein
MFHSRSDWTAAGFDVFDRSHENKIMVARHPMLEGLLVKKYSDSAPAEEQLANYQARVLGANLLQAFVRDHGLTRIVVPDKQIIELPPVFIRADQRSHVLVVQRLDILSPDDSIAAYRRVDPMALRELCFVLFHFRGLDSIVDNVPLTSDGRIAFIDTEKWSRGRKRPYMRHLRQHLSGAGRRLASKFFSLLKEGLALNLDEPCSYEGTYEDGDDDEAWPSPATPA